ncbi:MAG: hypothetical protein JRL30_10500 [Deltaproteobacteria bacterium]|nr:hypothetical protein [Deltaproteobacteria bacterium]
MLYEAIQPGGTIRGVDYSNDRICHATKHPSHRPGIAFCVHDLRDLLEVAGLFGLTRVRFVLEYNRAESITIVENLTACLKPGGHLCLLDLDFNCLTHFELPHDMEALLLQGMAMIEKEHNFDPYAGRKRYFYLYDLGDEDNWVDLRSHHLIYGKTKKAGSIQVDEETGNGLPKGPRRLWTLFGRRPKIPC